ncbi:MAG: carboxypeptidase-like regulatory domain-containing protein [Cytophagales bacterium]|jgi:hypothetical protein|nr:carboxypeptidase-like regulatory domain-containing protein [Cytophagales bacterium]
MKTIALCLTLFLVSMQLVVGQSPTQTVRGTVKDNAAQTAIPGATVVIVGTNPIRGTSTDAEGNFRLENVPVGRHTLKITSVGYEDQMVSELLVGSGKEVVITVGLTESLVQMQEIVISAAEQEKGTPRNEMTMLSARSISVDETKRYAASVNDPARAALSFAGVSTNNDSNNGIVIRGNSPRGLLWRLEGVEVPNPNHFGEEGASSGGISILSVNMLDNSDFLTGAFPAEYGNALSGVFDIKLRRGNNEKREYAAQIGVLGVDFAAEGPFRKNGKASYLVNYRYSTLGILSELGVDLGAGAAPDFQDLSFKLHFPTKKAGTFSFWGIGGLSRQLREAAKDSTQWKDWQSRREDQFVSNMGAVGLTHFYYLTPNSYLESVLSFSGRTSAYRRDSLNREIRPVREYNEDFTNTSWRLSTLYNHKFDAHHTLRAGLIVSQLDFDLFAEGFQTTDSVKRFTRFMSNGGGTQTGQAYVQWKYRISERLTLNTGMHALYLALNGSTSWEPRAGLKWQFAPKQSLAVGAGLHSRYEAMSTYFAEQRLPDGRVVSPNKNLNFTKARHAVISYENQLRSDMRLKMEAYYQHLYNVPIEPGRSTLSALNFQGGFTTDSLVNRGTGRNYGLEITLEKFFTNNYYFLITSSLYNSFYTGSDGVERNTRYNGNFVNNATFGKEFPVGRNKSNIIGVNLRLLWAGGNRYTPVDLEKSRERGEGVDREDQAFAIRASDYFRTDLRVSYRKNRPRASYTLSLDIQNVTNRQNVFGQFYDPSIGNIQTYYQVGLIPILNYRIEF